MYSSITRYFSSDPTALYQKKCRVGLLHASALFYGMGQTFSLYPPPSKANRAAQKKWEAAQARITPCQRAQKNVAMQKALVTRMQQTPTANWYTTNSISNTLNIEEPLVQLQQFRSLSPAGKQTKRNDMLREQTKEYVSIVAYMRKVCGVGGVGGVGGGPRPPPPRGPRR